MSVNSGQDHPRTNQMSPNCHIGQSIPSFLLKTYQILQNPGYSDIISWTKTGQGFVVKKVKQFAQKILPAHFRHSNYTSFVRQLNMYDFHKTRQQNQQNAFKNFMFKKGNRHLLRGIQRKDYKKNKDNTKPIQLNNQRNQQNYTVYDKKKQNESQIAKDFYNKWIPQLDSTSESFEKKATDLASIQQINYDLNKLLPLLDLLFQTKRINKFSLLKMQQFQQQWSAFIAMRGLSLKELPQNEKQNHVKQQTNPTNTTFNNSVNQFTNQ